MKYAKVDPSEERDFRLLFVQSLLSGFGASFFFVVANTYFIKKTSVPSLPPAYILSGVFGYILITMYKRWQRNSGVVHSYTVGFAIYGLSAIALYIGRLVFNDTSAVSVYIAYIGFIVVLPYSSMQAIGFSTICLRVFNIAQSKRLLALVGTGEVLASIIAYLTIPFLTKWLGGSAPLLLISGIANMAAIIPLRKTYKNNKEKLDSIRFSTVQKKMDFAFFKNDQFYLLMAIVTVFSVMAVYFADYTYLLSVRYIAAESGMEIAAVVAIVFSVIKTGELVVSLLSGNIIRSYGMKVSLLMLPAFLVLCSLIGFTTGVIFINIPFFLVFFLLLIKWNERVVRKGVTVPAMKVVYQVTDAEHRAQLQTSIDGTISQYATIIAGAFLWILSLSFSSNNILFFLRIIAFVYLVAFAGWTWYTLKLYNVYREKIMEYLHRFRTGKPHADVPDFDTDIPANVDVSVATHSNVDGLVKEVMDLPLLLNADTLGEYISFYNPQAKIAFAGDATILRKIRNAYYNNENFFSRLLIIAYIELLDEETKLNFAKEYYGISELQLKIHIIAMLNKKEQHIKPEDIFFFTGLIEDVASEIMWAEATIHDILNDVNGKLIEALQHHILTLKTLLFELLKVLYDKQSIQVVQDILNRKDDSLENHLFAVELLDNVLETQMKKLLMPVIEDSSFNSKKERLQKTLLIYHLSCTERLKEILMANFMMVGPYIKEPALQEYYRLTGDKTMLSAFAASYVEMLNASATTILLNGDDRISAAKSSAVHDLHLDTVLQPDFIAYFMKWGLFTKEKRKAHVGVNDHMGKHTYQFNEDYIVKMTFGNTVLNVDKLALSLVLRTNKKVTDSSYATAI